MPVTAPVGSTVAVAVAPDPGEVIGFGEMTKVGAPV